jgi:hypothetical protein
MRYATFKAGPWPKPGRLSRLLSCIFPRANPDFNEAYQRVVNWWLEIDDKNTVCREIAFDASGQVVALAPLERNHGIFTDLASAPMSVTDDIDKNAFEQHWRKFVYDWRITHGIQIDPAVSFPLTVILEDGKSEAYESIEDLECNLEDFDSESQAGCKVVDANGCPVLLKLEVLNLKELRLVHR